MLCVQKAVGPKTSKGAPKEVKEPAEPYFKPKLMKDEDSIKGGALYSSHLFESKESSGGIFCYECGSQIVATEECNVSIKIGKRVCARHMPAT